MKRIAFDERQKEVIQRTGMQSFIFMMLILLVYNGISLFHSLQWENQMYPFLFLMELPMFWFVMRITWKDAFLKAEDYKKSFFGFFFLGICMLVGGSIAIAYSTQSPLLIHDVIQRRCVVLFWGIGLILLGLSLSYKLYGYQKHKEAK